MKTAESTAIFGYNVKKGPMRTPSSLFSLPDLADLLAQATKSLRSGQQEKCNALASAYHFFARALNRAQKNRARRRGKSDREEVMPQYIRSSAVSEPRYSGTKVLKMYAYRKAAQKR